MKSKLKKFLTCALASICITSVVAGIVLNKAPIATYAKEYVATLSEPLLAEYDYGDVIVIPQATIDYNGVNLQATQSVVVFPNGKVYSNDTVMLVMSGEYTVIYYATIEGKTISADAKFKVNVANDVFAPIIDIDGGFNELTVAYSALNEEVSLPIARAIDENCNGEVEVFVYYNYDSESQTQVGVTDGKFIPRTIGEYVVVYSAKDNAGNCSSVERSILVSEVSGNVAVSMTTEEQEKAVAGTVVKIPEVQINGLYSDVTKLKMFAEFNGEKEEISNGEFLAKHVGSYTLFYEYQTPLKTYVLEKEFVVVSEDKVIFENYAIPNYFIKNARYTIDQVFATEYGGENPVYSATTAYIKQDTNDYVQIDCENFQVTASNVVKFKFVCGNESLETEEIQVVDVNFGKRKLTLENYFVSNLSKQITSSGVEFVADDIVKEEKISFVNVVSVSKFNLGWLVPEDSGKVNSIKIVLTDYYDSEKKVEIEYLNDGGTALFTVNGEKAQTLLRNFKAVTSNILYDSGFFYDGSGKKFAWESDFNSDRAFLDIYVTTAESDCSVVVTKISDQWFENGEEDETTPIFYIPEIQQGIWDFGETVYLPYAQITDIMTPYLKENARFQVRMPDNSYAVSTDGVALNNNCPTDRDYYIELTQYGRYMVVYSYVDQNGVEDMISYPIIVYDRRAPEIKISGVEEGEVKRVKAGEKVQIAKYTVTDGQTATEDLKSFVVVFNPTGAYMEKVNKSFTTSIKGAYRIVYYCIDADENYTSTYYTVIAE